MNANGADISLEWSSSLRFEKPKRKKWGGEKKRVDDSSQPHSLLFFVFVSPVALFPVRPAPTTSFLSPDPPRSAPVQCPPSPPHKQKQHQQQNAPAAAAAARHAHQGGDGTRSRFSVVVRLGRPGGPPPQPGLSGRARAVRPHGLLGGHLHSWLDSAGRGPGEKRGGRKREEEKKRAFSKKKTTRQTHRPRPLDVKKKKKKKKTFKAALQSYSYRYGIQDFEVAANYSRLSRGNYLRWDWWIWVFSAVALCAMPVLALASGSVARARGALLAWATAATVLCMFVVACFFSLSLFLSGERGERSRRPTSTHRASRSTRE